MFFAKQVGDHLRLFLAPIHMAAHDGQEFGPVGWSALAEPVGLDVLVQELVRIEFRAIARQPNEPQPLLGLIGKALGGTGSMYRMPSTIR